MFAMVGKTTGLIAVHVVQTRGLVGSGVGGGCRSRTTRAAGAPSKMGAADATATRKAVERRGEKERSISDTGLST